jgi:hypothetical protein
LAGVALVCFLLAVLAGGLSTIYPLQPVPKITGTAGLYVGVVLIAGAVLLELVHTMLSPDEQGAETADLDEPVREG